MSEKLPGAEHHELMKVPQEALVETHSHQKPESDTDAPEKAERQKRNLEYLKQEAEKHAEAREKTDIDEEKVSSEETQPVGHHQAEKKQNYHRTLKDVQSRLNPVDKKFSKFIHRPGVDTASQIAGRTIARPSAILGGGLAALLGSAVVLFAAKRYGFEYNFFIFLGLFMLGYFVGVIFEFIIRAIKHPGRS